MKLSQVIVCSLSLTALVALTGCHNYTAAPVCDESNAVVPAGITGDYTLSIQNEDFSVKTEKITISSKGKGRIAMKNLTTGDAKEDVSVCEVNGFYIQESLNEAVSGYEQERLYVTGMGLTVSQVFFDKLSLEAAGIEAKTFEVPENAAAVLGPVATQVIERFGNGAAALVSGKEAILGLMIDNRNTSAKAVMNHSYASPVGLTLLRK